MRIVLSCVGVGFSIFALSGCGSLRTQALANTQPPPAATVPMQPTIVSVVGHLTLQAPTQIVLPPNWTTVAWQGLIVPLPPHAQWQTLRVESVTDPVAPIAARGAITYTTKQEGVEQPHGPIFTIYVFSDSTEAWITLQEQRNAGFIDKATMTDTTLASQAAQFYQPLVTGTCNNGYYVTKADATHLLEVATECIDTEPYTTVINQLRFQAP